MSKFKGFLPLKQLLFKCAISHFGFPDEDPCFQVQLEIRQTIHLPIRGAVLAGFLREACPCRAHLMQADVLVS